MKSIVKQMKRHSSIPSEKPKNHINLFIPGFMTPKVIMESELFNPLNRQLRRLKRRGSGKEDNRKSKQTLFATADH